MAWSGTLCAAVNVPRIALAIASAATRTRTRRAGGSEPRHWRLAESPHQIGGGHHLNEPPDAPGLQLHGERHTALDEEQRRCEHHEQGGTADEEAQLGFRYEPGPAPGPEHPSEDHWSDRTGQPDLARPVVGGKEVVLVIDRGHPR